MVLGQERSEVYGSCDGAAPIKELVGSPWFEDVTRQPYACWALVC